MLKNSRVSGTLDVGRLGQALARPGMDTRVWVSLAIVEAVHVDAEEGVFVDVLCVPLRQRGTARLGTEYAGAGFGLYTPLEVDDEVLVEAPSGDPDEGLVVSRRLHSASDPPPSELVDHPEDVLLVVKPGKSVRIAVTGGGKVVLGGAAATEAAAFHSAIVALKDVLEAWVPVANDGGNALKLKLTTLIESGWPKGATKVVIE